MKLRVEVHRIGKEGEPDYETFEEFDVEARSLGDVLKQAATRAQAKFARGVSSLQFTLEPIEDDR